MVAPLLYWGVIFMLLNREGETNWTMNLSF